MAPWKTIFLYKLGLLSFHDCLRVDIDFEGVWRLKEDKTINLEGLWDV